MLDFRIGRLLEDAVNTSCKLALVLLYAEHGHFVATSQQLALRLWRDPWSVDTAIQELAQDGILELCDGKVLYRPQSKWIAALEALGVAYNDPYHRDAITALVHDLQRYAPYREELGSMTVNAR